MKIRSLSVKLGLVLAMVFSLSACSLGKEEKLGEINIVEEDKKENEVEIQKVDTSHIPQGKNINNIVSLYSYNRKDIDEFGFSALLPKELKLKKTLRNKNVVVFENHNVKENPYHIQISIRRFYPPGKTPEALQTNSLEFMRTGYRYYKGSNVARIANYEKGELEVVKDKDQEVYYDSDLYDDYEESFNKDDFLNPKKDFKRLYIREPLDSIRFSGTLFDSKDDSRKIHAENFYFNIDQDSYLVTVAGDLNKKEYIEEVGVMFASTYRLELVELSTEVYGGLDYPFIMEHSQFKVPEEFEKEDRWASPFIRIKNDESVLNDVMIQYSIYSFGEDEENEFNPFFNKAHQQAVLEKYIVIGGSVAPKMRSIVTSIINDESIGFNTNREIMFYEYMINDIEVASKTSDLAPVVLPLYVYETVIYNYEEDMHEVLTFVSPAHKKDMIRSLAIEVSQTYKKASK